MTNSAKLLISRDFIWISKCEEEVIKLRKKYHGKNKKYDKDISKDLKLHKDITVQEWEKIICKGVILLTVGFGESFAHMYYFYMNFWIQNFDNPKVLIDWICIYGTK